MFFLFFPKRCRINQVVKHLPLSHMVYNTLSPLPRMQRHSVLSHCFYNCMPEESGRIGRKVLEYLEERVRGSDLRFTVWTVCKQQGLWETICLWSYTL